MASRTVVAMVSWDWAKTFLPTPGQTFSSFDEKIHTFRTPDGPFTCKINQSKTIKVVRDNPECVECGLRPTHLKVVRINRRYNKYGDKYPEEDKAKLSDYPADLQAVAVLEDGRHVLFTKDHIYPRAYGGSNKYTNLQTMCEPCNHSKGCTIPNGVTHG